MERFDLPNLPETESKFYHLGGSDRQEKQILSAFSPEEQEEILHKQKILSSLAYFIGKDFKIPVELNEPGAGWHWDFKENIIRIDPKDLLEKPMDYLRFVISHEGGHRRISRMDFISTEEWQQPGFAFMMNAIEDPRDNNFVAESYPKFREQMKLAYGEDLDFEAKAKQTAQQTLGYQPRFMQAGMEYIKQWFRETEGKEFEVTESLPDEVKTVVSVTLSAAQDSWWHYPSRQEADQSEELIKKYAQVSYEINRDQIWPEFKKLIEADLADQKVEQFLKDKKEVATDQLKDQLSLDEQQLLQEVLEKALGDGPIDIDSLSNEIKEKIKEYIESLSEEEQQEILEKAQAALEEFEAELNKQLQSKLVEDPTSKIEKEKINEEIKEKIKEPKSIETEPPTPLVDEELEKYKQHLAQEIKKNANIYEQMRQEVLPIIDKLETELRDIFVARQAHGWQSGFTTGKRIDIKRRIQEKAKSVPAVESKAWQKREMPKEKDYAISLLVDLSGSMSENGKIKETFKAVIVLAEVLNRLSINLEILGFNDRIYEYQKFREQMSKLIREQMGGMLEEVNDSSDTGKARWNDDGWALDQTAGRLDRQKADHKFLVVLSDGRPEESPMHPRSKYELGDMIEKILTETDIRLIGLGIGRGTQHVASYYPNSLANVEVGEMAEKLAGLIKEVIANYDKF